MTDQPKAQKTGGRPQLPEADRLVRTLGLRVTDAQYDVLRARADLAGAAMSDYCRAALLGAKLRGRVDSTAAYQLQRIGNNLNQLAYHANATGRLGLEAEHRALLEEVRAAIRELL